MVEKEDIEELKFETEEEYKTFLEGKLQALKKDGEYVIFMHEMYEHAYGVDKSSLKEKKIGTLDNGLSYSKYASIIGTTKMVGDVDKISADDIINYSYYDEKKEGIKPSLILAFPKYITINGEKVEFVTYKGETPRSKNSTIVKELKDIYRHGTKYGFVPATEDMRYCMLDVVVKYGHLPAIYNLGIQERNLDDGSFTFISKGKHYSQKKPHERKEFDKSLEEECLKEIERFGVSDMPGLMVKSYEEFFAETSKYDEI